MNITGIVITALFGGLGATMRFIVDAQITKRLGTRYPWATTIINASGSLVLGVLTGIAFAGDIGIPYGTALSLGLMGGFTTFSTASVETVRLFVAGRIAAAAANAFGSLGLGILLAEIGVILGACL